MLVLVKKCGYNHCYRVFMSNVRFGLFTDCIKTTIRFTSSSVKHIYVNSTPTSQTSRIIANENQHITMESSILSPPKSVRGLMELDRKKFTKTVKIPKIEFENINTASVMPYVKKYLLKMENIKPVKTQESNHTSVLFNPAHIKGWTDIDVASRENLVALGISEKNFKIDDLTLIYENWRADEILKAVLPPDKDSVSSFSKIGHIVHVNLKDYLLPYKGLIGQVLLDKVKACRTVVNKIDTIDDTYRFFKMEVLCGEKNMQCEVKENHCRFDFDFSTVYWNPRLCTEHERITNMLKKGDVLYDVFAGVGPFAIPCAKRGVVVIANDLNPESFKWLNHNAKLNKIKPECLQTFNMDGRRFIRETIKSDMLDRLRDNKNHQIHITMNLPASAVEFLDVFPGLYTNELDNLTFSNPIVHVYYFAKGEFPEKLAIAAVENHLGCHLSESLREVFHVRNVSPKKEMIRISFALSRDVLCGKSIEFYKNKRKRTEDTVTDLKKYCHGETEKEAQADTECFQGSQECEGEEKSQTGDGNVEKDQ